MPTALHVTVMKSTSQHVAMTQTYLSALTLVIAGVTCSSKGMQTTSSNPDSCCPTSCQQHCVPSEGALRLVHGSTLPSRELVPLTSCTDPSLH